MLSPLAVRSPQLAVVRVDCPPGPAAAVQASPLLPSVASPPHAKQSIKAANSAQSPPVDTLAVSGDIHPLICPLSIMPRHPQDLVVPTPVPLLPLAPLAPLASQRPSELARRQNTDDNGCTCAVLFSLIFQTLIIGIFAFETKRSVMRLRRPRGYDLLSDQPDRRNSERVYKSNL